MAANTQDIYLKMKVDTKQFDSSITGMKKEMTALKGLIGNSLLSPQDNLALKKRFGDLKDDFDDVLKSAKSLNVQSDAVFGNMAQIAGVAVSAVAGLTGAMTLLGLETGKAGQVEKDLLSMMAIANSLSQVADAKRLVSMAKVYGEKVKELILGKDLLSSTEVLTAAKLEQVAATEVQSASTGTLTAATLASAASLTDGAESAILLFNAEAKVADATNNLARLRLALTDAEAELNMVRSSATASAEELSIAEEDQAIATRDLERAKLKLIQTELKAKTMSAEHAALLRGETLGHTANAGAIRGEAVAGEVGNVVKGKSVVATKLAALANTKFIVSVRAAAVATWNWTVALLANPIVWFAAAVIAVYYAIKGIISIFTAQERAQEKVNKATKQAIDYMKDLAAATEDTRDEIARLNDELLVQAKRQTESWAKKRDLNRKFNKEVKDEDVKKNKEIADIQKKYKDGDIKSLELYYRLMKSVHIRYGIWLDTEKRELSKRLALIDLDDANKKKDKDAADAEKAKGVEEQRLEKLKAAYEKRKQALKDLENANNAELLALEMRNFEDRLNELNEAYAKKTISEVVYNQAIRDIGLETLDIQLKRLKDDYDAFEGNEADKVKLKTQINDKLQEIENKQSENTIKRKDDEKKETIKFLQDEITLIDTKISTLDLENSTLETLRGTGKLSKEEEALNKQNEIENLNKISELLKEQIRIKILLIKANQETGKSTEEETNAIASLENQLTGIKARIIELNAIELKNPFADWDLKTLDEKLQMIGGFAQDALGVFNDFADAMWQKQLDTLQRQTEASLKIISDTYDQTMETLDSALKHANLTQEQYDRQKAKLDKEKLEKEKALKTEEAKKNKEYQIFKATMNAANAVIAGLLTQPFAPVGLIMGALAGALGAVQVGIVKSTPLPTFGKGGPIVGQPHSKGGVDINAEDGEYIINKKSAQAPNMRPILDSINGGKYQPGPSMDINTIKKIVSETVQGITSIPVVVMETDVTSSQRKISVIENQSSW